MVNGNNSEKIIIFEFDVTGALSLASSMLYPKTLAGAAVFSGWVPLEKSAFAAKITPAAKQVLLSLTISHGGSMSNNYPCATVVILRFCWKHKDAFEMRIVVPQTWCLKP